MNSINKNKYDLDTPCLVIDIDVLGGNLEKMEAISRSAGKRLRPHAKTHKCSAIALRQMEAGAVGICTAKLSEAEVLVGRGLRGILITGPIVTHQKIERLMNVLTEDPSLILVLDNSQNAEILDKALSSRHLSMDVLVDIDVGLKRTGVAPGKALELAEKISHCASLRLRGIQAYAGQVQHLKPYKARRRASLECMEKATKVFHELGRAGIQCDIFTGAGTGTHDIDLNVNGLTDLQVGSYAVMDAEYIGIGSRDNLEKFEVFKPALTLLTSVVSANHNDFVTVDAGLKALYKDGASPMVLTPAGSRLRYEWFGDEYGMIIYQENSSAPKVGAVIELVVSHCDPTINQFDHFYVIQADEVVDIWPIDLRGKSQ
jgi:D-serine deaminase-like pyridoxal phosphate-dependent protein